MKKPTYKELESKYTSLIRKDSLWSIILFIIILSLTIFYNYQIVTMEKELNQLKTLGSVYTDTEGNAFIRFNNTDQHQQALLKEIQAYCIRNQISRCMPSYEAILAEGRR